MSTAKFDLEKFIGKNDFGLWKLKMKAVMMQQGLWEILKGGGGPAARDEDGTAAAKNQDLQDKAYSTLIVSLNDRVLRGVSKEESAAEVWAKLESIYQTKSLANRLHLKQKLFTFKISESKSILEQLEDFGKCVDDLEMIEEKIKDEDKALMLLNIGKDSWPELLGVPGEEAVKVIEKENFVIAIIVPPTQSFLPGNFSCGRVWVFVDDAGVVTRVPRIG